MIDHKESSVKVYHSSNYGLFKMLDGNRDLNESKIKRIMADIESGIDVLRYYPIQVREEDGRLKIIDGQHRFYIGKKLGRAVFYILMTEERTIGDIAKINSNVEKWKAKDFINAYVRTDVQDYKILDEFMQKYSISVTLAAALLEHKDAAYGMGGPEGISRFQRGQFKATYLTEATQLADVCQHFKEFKHWKDARFFTAIQKIIEAGKIDVWDLVKKVNNYRDELSKQVSWKEYISNLESIWNKRLQSRQIIWE